MQKKAWARLMVTNLIVWKEKKHEKTNKNLIIFRKEIRKQAFFMTKMLWSVKIVSDKKNAEITEKELILKISNNSFTNGFAGRKWLCSLKETCMAQWKNTSCEQSKTLKKTTRVRSETANPEQHAISLGKPLINLRSHPFFLNINLYVTPSVFVPSS